MATVPENLEKILQARYGEEVRGSIHDAIEDCYDYVNGNTIASMMDMSDVEKIVAHYTDLTIGKKSILANSYYLGSDGSIQSAPSEDYSAITFEHVSALEGSIISFAIPNYLSNVTDLTGLAFFDSEGNVIDTYRYTKIADVTKTDNSVMYKNFLVPYGTETIGYTNVTSIIGEPQEATFYVTSLSNIFASTILFGALADFNEKYTDLMKASYIRHDDGSVAVYPFGNEFSASQFMIIPGRSREFIQFTRCTNGPTDQSSAIAFYDLNKNFISSYKASDIINLSIFGRSNTNDSFVWYRGSVPPNARFYRVTVASPSHKENNQVCRIWFYKNDSYHDESEVSSGAGSIECFLNVGCIGDSLASGESVSSSGHHTDFYQHSWGQYLSRATGNKYYNWSKGGLTARQWLDSSYATECFDAEHKCECYIIGLGQNDYNQSVSIGSSADIGSSYLDNPDTFYGNYGGIISRIIKMQPKAKIFVLTDPLESTESSGYNDAIRYMPTKFPNNVFLIDLYKDISNEYSAIVDDSTQWKSGHGNALSYRKFAYLLAKEINDYMNDHQDQFDDIQFIGTDYNW